MATKTALTRSGAKLGTPRYVRPKTSSNNGTIVRITVNFHVIVNESLPVESTSFHELVLVAQRTHLKRAHVFFVFFLTRANSSLILTTHSKVTVSNFVYNV